MHLSFVQITDSGVSLANATPAFHSQRNYDYTRRPVAVAVHHDLKLEIHGKDFTASTKLSVDDALGLITMLSYVVREQLAIQAATAGRA